MKAEERHHLEQNELADGVSRFMMAARPYTATAAIVAVVLIGAGLVAGYVSGAAAQKRQEAWDAYMAATSVGEFELVMQKYGDTSVAPYALLRIADFTFREGEGTLISDRSKAVQKIDEAIKSYEKLSRDSANPIVARQSSLSTGIAYETQGAIAKARQAYERTKTQFAGSPEADQAGKYLKRLDEPETKQFYERLASYQPPERKIDLPAPIGETGDSKSATDPKATEVKKETITPILPKSEPSAPKVEEKKTTETKAEETKPTETKIEEKKPAESKSEAKVEEKKEEKK